MQPDLHAPGPQAGQAITTNTSEKGGNVKDKDTRGRKMKSDNVRVVPEFREQVDIEKLCQALIEIAKSIAKEQATTPPDKPTQT